MKEAIKRAQNPNIPEGLTNVTNLRETKMINLTINNKPVQAEEGTTIMEAAQRNCILIPHLCYLENIHRFGACRVCVVEVEGARTLMASCVTPVAEGMVVQTNTPRVRNARKVLYYLTLSDHTKDCLVCSRNQQCELQQLGELIKVNEFCYEGERSKDIIDYSSPSIVRDSSKCILCRRCVTVCNDIQGVGLINPHFRGFATQIGPPEGEWMGDSVCTNCGQCVLVCPVGALKEKDAMSDVWEALGDETKVVVVQTAPAVRAALGELFGYEAGTLVTGKMVTSLKELGFDYVFDTNFGADLTIMEEGSEFLERLKTHLNKRVTSSDGVHKDEVQHCSNGNSFHHEKEPVLPMITSCSPGWVKFVEHRFPEQLDHLSSCKSPHMMIGAMVKTYFAEKMGIDPKNIFVVSVMPCTAKKYEIVRPEMMRDGMQDVDAVLTTRELADMIKDAGIDFRRLSDGDFDSPLGLSSGAADIFGTTGGVMEAAIRTVYELVTGRELPTDGLHVEPLAGLERIKTAGLKIEKPLEEYASLDGVTLRVAVTSGLKGAAELLAEVREGNSPYHFIEVMGCPGGCMSGGGQPRPVDDAIRLKRMEAIYREDEGKQLRKSHNNKDIIALYDEFLGKPLGHLSHELLHTHYVKRDKY